MIATYENGNTRVKFNTEDGTRERFTNDDEFRLDFAESIDCTITYKCSQNCPYCCTDCSQKGKAAKLKSKQVDRFVESLKPYTELAINGNDLDTKNLRYFLINLNQHGIIVNMTVNENQFMQHYRLLESWSSLGWIHELGITVTGHHNKNDEIFNIIKMNFPNAVLHFVVGAPVYDLYRLGEIGGLKLHILGYKKKGRGVEYHQEYLNQITTNIELLKTNWKHLSQYFNSISFDDLAVEQLDIKSQITPEDWSRFYKRDEGSQTFYADLVNGTFARNSLINESYRCKDYSWSAVEMFHHIQSIQNNVPIA